jgi:hypothetical protein
MRSASARAGAAGIVSTRILNCLRLHAMNRSALVHQWGNPGNEPLTFLAFNINPEGVAAVLPGAPAKIQ